MKLRGVRTHNLASVDAEFEIGKWTSVCGVSGSGKTSLAFHTLHAEAERRWLSTLPAWRRNLSDAMARPPMDSAAGLVPTLEGKGPFTVFAPTNAAFAKLPQGTVDSLLKPENKQKLTSVLTYHVVAGKLDMKALEKKIKAGGGKAELKTVNGESLWVMANGPHNIQLKDAQGNVASITTYDVNQSNGVIDVIDTVLMP